MSNSDLVKVLNISPNKSTPRNHVIDTITIHCVVGQLSASKLGELFSKSSKKASSNYGIGTDGTVGMYVEEKDRSWCSSNGSNDNRAITIECASDATAPYAINGSVYRTLIELCADICRRNNIKELKWKADKSLIGHIEQQNMTVHRWFSAKECPGEYIYSRLGQIALEVNQQLGIHSAPASTSQMVETSTSVNNSYMIKVTADVLNIRSGPGIEYPKVGTIVDHGSYTIVETKTGFGKLKSGAGWISLTYTSKI